MNQLRLSAAPSFAQSEVICLSKNSAIMPTRSSTSIASRWRSFAILSSAPVRYSGSPARSRVTASLQIWATSRSVRSQGLAIQSPVTSTGHMRRLPAGSVRKPSSAFVVPKKTHCLGWRETRRSYAPR